MFDARIVGRKYTWYKPSGSAKSILDGTLLSDEWLQK